MKKNGVTFFFFFFQAEDGIRDYKVTGVQTCALPISLRRCRLEVYHSGQYLGGSQRADRGRTLSEQPLRQCVPPDQRGRRGRLDPHWRLAPERTRRSPQPALCGGAAT